MKIEVKPSQVTLKIGDVEIQGFMDGTFLNYEPEHKLVPMNGSYSCTVTCAHDHNWQPIDGECGRYACGCTAQGRRDLRTGKIELVQQRWHVPIEVHPGESDTMIQLDMGCRMRAALPRHK